MNTQTPAQALGEVMADIQAIMGARNFTITKFDNGDAEIAGPKDFMLAVTKCLDLVITHGKHFAGLEAEAENTRETLAKALDADGVNDEPLRMLAVRASNALYWRSVSAQEYRAKAEAAEARCAELDAEVERCKSQAQTNARLFHEADAAQSVAERTNEVAIGLLREVSGRVPMSKQISTKGPEWMRTRDKADREMYKRIAAFLAARG